MKDFELNARTIGLFIQELWKLDLTKSWRISLVSWRKSRSLSQNSLYWKWMSELSKQAYVNGKQFDGETWAEFFKKYYCPDKVIVMPLGEDITIKSTTKLDAGEMHHYLNKIQAWCMSEGYSLTIPESCEYQKLLDKQDE